MLKEREELLALKPGSKDVAEASHRLRTRIKEMRESTNKLQNIAREMAKKPDANPVTTKEHLEIVELVFKHVEEIEAQEKRRYAGEGVAGPERSALLSGAGGGMGMRVNIKASELSAPTSILPSIDDDPEVSGGLMQLQDTNKQIVLIDETIGLTNPLLG
jgi:hypothetical protein